jgi:hypothetical protein
VRSEIAWVLREWSTALADAQHGVGAETYAYAIELVTAFLDDRQTLADLLDAYYLPSAELSYLVRDLCATSATPLQPHLPLGASCAVRLRELMKQVIA